MTQSGMIKGKQINIESINLIPNESPLALTSFTVSTASTTFSGKQLINLDYLDTQLDLKLDISRLDDLTISATGIWSSAKIDQEINNVGGGSVIARWKYNDSTSASDPGAGEFRTNTSNSSTVTEIYIAEETENGGDFSVLLGALNDTSRIYLQNVENAQEFGFYQITSNTDNGSWITLGVTASGVGADTNWEDGKEFGVVLFYNIDPATNINDLIIATDSTWSSNKINNEILGLSSSVNLRIDTVSASVIGLSQSLDSVSISVDNNSTLITGLSASVDTNTINIDSVSISVANLLNDSITGSTTGWTSQKINSELDLKLDDSQLNDSITGTNSLWSSDKINTEITNSSFYSSDGTLTSDRIVDMDGNGINFSGGSGSVLNLSNDGSVRISNAFTLPTIDGTAGYVLQTDGNGTVSWALDDVGLTGSGAVNQVAFFDGTSSLTGTNDLTYTGQTFSMKFSGAPSFEILSDVIGGQDAELTIRGSRTANPDMKLAKINFDNFAFNAIDKRGAVIGIQNVDNNVGADNDQVDFSIDLSDGIGATPSVTERFRFTESGQFRIWDNDQSNYLSISAGSLTQSLNYVFPNTYGITGQVLSNDGSGTLSWIDVASINDGSTSSTTSVWSANKIYTELENKIDVGLTESYILIGSTQNIATPTVTEKQYRDSLSDILLTEFYLDSNYYTASIAQKVESSQQIGEKTQQGWMIHKRNHNEDIQFNIDISSASYYATTSNTLIVTDFLGADILNIIDASTTSNFSLTVSNIVGIDDEFRMRFVVDNGSSVTFETTTVASASVDQILLSGGENKTLQGTTFSDYITFKRVNGVNKEVELSADSITDNINITINSNIDDTATSSTTSLWSANKIYNELELKLDDSQLDDGTISATGLWSSNKINTELLDIRSLTESYIYLGSTANQIEAVKTEKIYLDNAGSDILSETYLSTNYFTASIGQKVETVNQVGEKTQTDWLIGKKDPNVDIVQDLDIASSSLFLTASNQLNISTFIGVDTINLIDSSDTSFSATVSSIFGLSDRTNVRFKVGTGGNVTFEHTDIASASLYDISLLTNQDLTISGGTYSEFIKVQNINGINVEENNASTGSGGVTINDSSTSSTTETWSADKIYTEIISISVSGGNLLNDSITGSTTGWSSEKIDNELDLKINTSQISATGSPAVTAIWSGAYLDVVVNSFISSLDLKLNTSQLNDAGSSVNTLWSANKIQSELDIISASASNILNDGVTGSTSGWSSQKIDDEIKASSIYTSDGSLTQSRTFNLNDNELILPTGNVVIQSATSGTYGYVIQDSSGRTASSLLHNGANDIEFRLLSNPSTEQHILYADSDVVAIGGATGMGFVEDFRVDGKSVFTEQIALGMNNSGLMAIRVEPSTFSDHIMRIGNFYDFFVDSIGNYTFDGNDYSFQVDGVDKYRHTDGFIGKHSFGTRNPASLGTPTSTEIELNTKNDDGSLVVYTASMLYEYQEATGVPRLTISQEGTNNLVMFNNGGVRISDAYTLPIVDGATGQYLQTNGNGTVSWVDITSSSIGINDGSTSSTTSVWSANKSYTEIVGLSQSIDSVSISVSNILNDSITGSTTGWSSNKIDSELDLKVDDAQISQVGAVGATDIWSGAYLDLVVNSFNAALAAKLDDSQLNDNGSSTNTIWSANKIQTEIDNASLYTSNGTLSSNRTINANESSLTLDNGQFIIQQGIDTIDYGLVVQSTASNTRAKLVYDAQNLTGELDVSDETGSFFSASAGTVRVNGNFRILDNDQSNFLQLSAGALTQSLTLIFPDTYGATGQVLTTDGGGTLSWTTPSGGGGGVSSLTESHIFFGNASNEAVGVPTERIYKSNLQEQFLSVEYLFENHYTASIGQKIETKYQVGERTQQGWLISKKNENQDIIFDIDISNLANFNSNILDVERFIGVDVLNIIDSTTSSFSATVSSIFGMKNNYNLRFSVEEGGTVVFEHTNGASASSNDIVNLNNSDFTLINEIGNYYEIVKRSGIHYQIKNDLYVTDLLTTGVTVSLTNYNEQYFGLNISGAVTVTLPDANNDGKVVIFKDESGSAGASVVTISCTCDQATSIAANYDSLKLIWRGTKWWII